MATTHRQRMEARGVKDPRDQPFTRGGRREGLTSHMALGSFDGVDDVWCDDCEEYYPAFHSVCPTCRREQMRAAHRKAMKAEEHREAAKERGQGA